MTDDTLHEHTGAVHLHSTYSDGSGSVDEMLRAARGTGVDFLVLTDHNTLEARDDGYEGWHDDVLLIVGDEVSNRDGHCLALGIRRHVNHRQDLGGILEGIRGEGGDAYIAHPHGRYRPLFTWKDHSWQDWDAGKATGLELWSYMFDWASSFHYIKLIRHYRNPDACLNGPDPATVAKYDELCLSRRVVAFGGIDAHARRYPLLPLVVFPYDQAFRTLRTHVLTPEPLSESERDISRILGALSEGRCFISLDNLADGSGARFQTSDGDVLMGDEVAFVGERDIELRLPREADIVLLRNGERVASDRADALRYRAKAPGVYRAEARIGGRPWLYTNPIYLRRTLERADP